MTDFLQAKEASQCAKKNDTPLGTCKEQRKHMDLDNGLKNKQTKKRHVLALIDLAMSQMQKRFLPYDI